MKFARAFLFLVLIALFTISHAQKIHESDLEISSLMLHYQHFPNVEKTTWYQLDNEKLQARFTYQGSEKIVTYTSKMKILQEWTKIENIPGEVDFHLQSNYDNCKITAVFKVVDHINDLSFYSVKAKMKKEGWLNLTYDELYNQVENNNNIALLDF
ncbi:hypothetical protein [Ekhidna sp.]|uniref:hypothetical protein n=1 Tax=Ekhidna sp. TaxID=2608089 RepID=UPI003B51198B